VAVVVVVEWWEKNSVAVDRASTDPLVVGIVDAVLVEPAADRDSVVDSLGSMRVVRDVEEDEAEEEEAIQEARETPLWCRTMPLVCSNERSSLDDSMHQMQWLAIELAGAALRDLALEILPLL